MRSFEDFEIGEAWTNDRFISDKDVELFSILSGDVNKIHLDDEFAKETLFRNRIVHGSLCASFISALISSTLKDHLVIYLSQNLEFLKPVYIGDKVITKITLENITKVNIFQFNTMCFVGDRAVITGSAKILCAYHSKKL